MTSAASGSISNAIVATELSHASSYRVTFRRDQFLALVDFARPRAVYRRGKNFFFAFDGFVMLCQECKDEDVSEAKLFETVELSNTVRTS